MWQAVLFRSLSVVVAILLVFAVILYFCQDGMIYMPRTYSEQETQELEGSGLMRIDFETDQGQQGAFYKSSGGRSVPKRIWLVFGGNGGRATEYRQLAADPLAGYYFIDYPGYGLCEGKPTPKRIDETVDAALVALQERLGYDADMFSSRLAVFGHSLGAAVGLRAAGRHSIGRVVLVAPFTTMKEMAAGVVGKMYSNVLRHRFDNLVAMEVLVGVRPDVAVTVISGREDREIAAEMGQRLSRAFAEVTTFMLLEDVGHNDIIDRELGTIQGVMGGR